MPEEVLFSVEHRQTRRDIATALRDVADKLDAGDPVTFSAGEDSVTLDPPDQPTFEVKVERETAAGAETGELSIELELEWDEGGEGGSDAELSVE
jgi:amphi-Trp domain-containing protein